MSSEGVMGWLFAVFRARLEDISWNFHGAGESLCRIADTMNFGTIPFQAHRLSIVHV